MSSWCKSESSAKQSGKEMLKNELTINILLDMLFGKSSDNYEDLYNSGLIDETFQFDYTQEQGFGFAIVGSDTKNPDLTYRNDCRQSCLRQKWKHLLTKRSKERRKSGLVAFYGPLNSPEYIANQFTRYAFNEMDLFEVVPVLEELTFTGYKKRCK